MVPLISNLVCYPYVCLYVIRIHITMSKNSRVINTLKLFLNCMYIYVNNDKDKVNEYFCIL